MVPVILGSLVTYSAWSTQRQCKSVKCACACIASLTESANSQKTLKGNHCNN